MRAVTKADSEELDSNPMITPKVRIRRRESQVEQLQALRCAALMQSLSTGSGTEMRSREGENNREHSSCSSPTADSVRLDREIKFM